MVDWIAWGLGLDCIGVLVMTIPEYGAATWPVIGRLGNSRAKKRGMNELAVESQLESGDAGFSDLICVIEKHVDLEPDIQPSKLKITGHFGKGNSVIVSGDNDQQTVSSPGVLQNWVENEISRAYLRTGLALLLIGFAVQLFSRIGLI